MDYNHVSIFKYICNLMEVVESNKLVGKPSQYNLHIVSLLLITRPADSETVTSIHDRMISTCLPGS